MAFKMNGWSAFTKEIDPVTGKERGHGKDKKFHKKLTKLKEGVEPMPPLTPQEISEYERKQKIQENIRKNTLKTNTKSETIKNPHDPIPTAKDVHGSNKKRE